MGRVSNDDAMAALSRMYLACESMATKLEPGQRETGWINDHGIIRTYLVAQNGGEVEHPSHYQTDGGLECIEVMREVFGEDAVRTFARLNAFKYLWRAGKKDGQSTEKDLAKAAYYLSI